MMLEDIRTKLLGAGLTNVFIGRIPPIPDNCIGLFDTYGRVPDAKHQYNKPSFQVRIRGIDYSEVKTRANTIYSLLQSLSTTQIGDTWFVDIQAMQDPYHLMMDEKDRAVFVQNFITEIQETLSNRI